MSLGFWGLTLGTGVLDWRSRALWVYGAATVYAASGRATRGPQGGGAGASQAWSDGGGGREPSVYVRGHQSPQAAKAQAFAEDLRKELGATVHLWDERLTTTQAHRHLDDAGHAAIGRKGIIDQVAAVLILQSFLEARANQRGRS